MAKLPAYITIAFDLTGALNIQQIQYREVLDVDGVPTEVKQYPVDLIKAPQENDQLTALLKDAVGAIAAGHLEAVRIADVARDEAVAKFEAVDGANIEQLQQDLANANANIQVLMAELESLKK